MAPPPLPWPDGSHGWLLGSSPARSPVFEWLWFRIGGTMYAAAVDRLEGQQGGPEGARSHCPLGQARTRKSVTLSPAGGAISRDGPLLVADGGAARRSRSGTIGAVQVPAPAGRSASASGLARRLDELASPAATTAAAPVASMTGRPGSQYSCPSRIGSASCSGSACGPRRRPILVSAAG
jgi:hypothetical protein